MASRNAQYEQRRIDKGEKKITLWVPQLLEAEFKLLADTCCANRNLSINTVRDTKTGRYVSLERAVTDDASN